MTIMDLLRKEERFFAFPRFPDPLPDWPAVEPSNKPNLSEFHKEWSEVTECAICLQVMEKETKVYVKDCRHPFCFSCISHWMKSFERNEINFTPACPTCKHPSTEVYKVFKGNIEVIQVTRRPQLISWPEIVMTPRDGNSNPMLFDPEDVYFVRELNETYSFDPFYATEWEETEEPDSTSASSALQDHNNI